MNGLAAALYVVCRFLWSLACIGGCAWIVFYEGYSGWWFVLAVYLVMGETANNAARIASGKKEGP